MCALETYQQLISSINTIILFIKITKLKNIIVIKMQVVCMKNNNTKIHALVVPTDEWKRLQKILTKNDDEKAAIEEIKRLKKERQTASKTIAESFDNTTLNNRRKELEKRKMLLADMETRQIENDKKIKLDILERRNLIVEKAQANKWLARDSTKTVTRAEQNMEVLRERNLQMEFNEVEKTKMLENERLLKIEQILEAKRYKKELWEEQLKQTEIKKSNAATYLKILKERKDEKRDEDFKLKEEGKAELQKIANDIEEDNKKKKSKIQEMRESMLKNLNDNREIIRKNNELRQLEEQEENMTVAIMYEAKKGIAKIIKLKEIEILKEKLTLSDKMTKLASINQSIKKNVSDIAFQKAVDEKEHQYQKEQLRIEELFKKRKIDLEKEKKRFDEETKKEKERLQLSRQWELERRLQETEALRDFEESRRRANINKMKGFRENLDTQCDNNRAASMANKRKDLKYYNELIRLWRGEDEKFLTHTKNLINKYKKANRSVIPLLKSIKDYMKNNTLLIDAANRSPEVDLNCLNV